ncbi:hypothetical protein FACS1894137_15990 [Spirochaetia bacterium]|nr:hypothetical protein FACS1894137_15990 [Spirochaetia bacterium]
MFPCIVKANHSQGDNLILRNNTDVDWKELKILCRKWLKRDYYACGQEWPYKNIERKIIVEKLLQTQNAKLPNDYKLHYINGELEFVYVTVDREGENKRNIYDADWNPLYFTWYDKSRDSKTLRGKEIPAPTSFNMMKQMGHIIAEYFSYVRVDFYDVDGRLYFGEITLYHGSGFDVFVPAEYDLFYGNKLKL